MFIPLFYIYRNFTIFTLFFGLNIVGALRMMDGWLADYIFASLQIFKQMDPKVRNDVKLAVIKLSGTTRLKY